MSLPQTQLLYAITPASPDEVNILVNIDRATSRLFAPTGLLSEEALNDHVPASVLANAIETGNVFTARIADYGPVGFALVSLRGGILYLDQISVHPDQGRQGIGASLLIHVIDEARRRKLRRVTLSTFRDLPWNGPFYRKHGFRELKRPEMADWMLELEQIQAEDLDVSKRCFMMRKIGWL